MDELELIKKEKIIDSWKKAGILPVTHSTWEEFDKDIVEEEYVDDS